MSIIPPYCPKYLRVNWVTDEYGKLTLSCIPTTEDTVKDTGNKIVLYYIIGIALTICLILVTYKIKHNTLRRHKKIAHAYPYSRFAPHYV